MAALFMDGFDKYGGTNTNTAVVAALLTGEWTTVNAFVTIAAGLSATGFAVQTGSGSGISKTLPAAMGRMIGGFRVKPDLVAHTGVQLQDAATSQCAIRINTDGTISVRNGLQASGTVLGTSAVSIGANTTHHIEFDITFGNAAPYQIWLDGVSVLSGSGDTTATANNTANVINVNTASGGIAVFDDLYIFDTTGSTNNAVLLTSPRIETQFPASDGAVQFAVGASILGSSTARLTGAGYSPGSNNLYVRPLIPTVNCMINSLGLLPSASSGTIQLRPVLYADSSNAPGALMSAGSIVVGMTNGVVLTMPLTTPQSLVAGTRYWLGVMNDLVGPSYAGADTLASGRWAISTFSSGAPGTCPATTGGQNTVVIFGNISGVTGNFYEVSQNPPSGYSYVYDATIGHEDLYNFPALTAPSPTIHAVAVKGNVAKSDSGAKTMTLRTKSSTTDSAGSASSLAPSTAYGWMTSLFPTDPATSAAWSLSGLNAAQAGIRVET